MQLVIFQVHTTRFGVGLSDCPCSIDHASFWSFDLRFRQPSGGVNGLCKCEFGGLAVVSFVSLEKPLNEFRLIFWDFDGVIKESVELKTSAFYELFLPFGISVARRIQDHHFSNGGMSRFDKMPLYLGWAKQDTSIQNVTAYCEIFSIMVQQAVIQSEWVPGVEAYIKNNHQRQFFVLVTATPIEEIRVILHRLQLLDAFKALYGAPTTKQLAIFQGLRSFDCLRSDALMIGDSEADLVAAKANRVPFLLRRTKENILLQERFSGPSIDDFQGCHG